jgi:hypothetical protein
MRARPLSLSLSHDTGNFVNEIRCRSCYKYGHIRRYCLSQSRELWVPKRKTDLAVKDPVASDRVGINFPLDSSGAVSSHRDLLQVLLFLLKILCRLYFIRSLPFCSKHLRCL